MSASNSRIKINVKEGTIEVEGSEDFVKTIIEEYRDIFSNLQKGIKTKPTPVSESKEDKKDKRGGPRSRVISPAIDKLIDDGYLKDFKTIREVMDELKRLSIPGVSDKNVGAALS